MFLLRHMSKYEFRNGNKIPSSLKTNQQFFFEFESFFGCPGKKNIIYWIDQYNTIIISLLERQGRLVWVVSTRDKNEFGCWCESSHHDYFLIISAKITSHVAPLFSKDDVTLAPPAPIVTASGAMHACHPPQAADTPAYVLYDRICTIMQV